MTAAMSAAQSVELDHDSAPPILASLPANSLFHTWRPKAHVMPASGHTGDPCAAFLCEATGLFHQGFLYTPQGSSSHSAAAAVTTSDFVHWQDLHRDSTDPTILRPGGSNDKLAVFDGTVIPKGHHGLPTLVYTSVNSLPIHWTLPYVIGSETQSIAISHDNGTTFDKLERSPVIPSPPIGLDVTGWRDPFMFQNTQFDDLLDSPRGSWYACISAGTREGGPCLFLYRQGNANFTEWSYVGPFWKEERNGCWGDGTWAGRFGFNFEVGNLFGLDAKGDAPDGTLFTLVGTEGGEPLVEGGRAQLWTSGTLEGKKDAITFNVNMAGKLDWGRGAYAAAAKLLPACAKSSRAINAGDRQIAALWLTQDFFGSNPYPVDQQGWDGQLTTLRELWLLKLCCVSDDSLVREVGSWQIVSEDAQLGTVEITTLGQAPMQEVVAAWHTGRTVHEAEQTFSSTAIRSFNSSISTRQFVITATLSFPTQARSSADVQAGFRILSSAHEHTAIYYDFATESIVVERSNSSAAARKNPGFDTTDESGKLRLFNIKQDGQTQIEKLRLRIVVDNSIIEVYANDRFALSTLVFPWYNASLENCFFYRGSVPVVFSGISISEGLFNAWPNRG